MTLGIREKLKARHGKTRLYMIQPKDACLPQATMAEALGAEMQRFDIADGSYLQAYERVVNTIEENMR